MEANFEPMPGHWSTTEEGSLVARCTVFIYQKFQTSEREGGWVGFIEEHCGLFNEDADDEHNLECFNLFKRFETMIEEAFEEFAEKENMSSLEIARIIADVDDSSVKACKVIKKLLHSFTYAKFSQIMRDKAGVIEDLAT